MKDYVSPGLSVVHLDAALSGLRAGSASTSPWSRWWIEHNLYVDPHVPTQVFTTRDEAAILHTAALQVRGQNCLQVGGGQDWSGLHIALGSRALDIVDASFHDVVVVERITAQFEIAGVGDCIALHQETPDRGITGAGLWRLIFLHAPDVGDVNRQYVSHLAERAADNCIFFVSDLASPHKAAAFRQLRDAGWHTKLYHTAQILGVAWRGDLEPPTHVPDPDIAWTLPRHLSEWAIAEAPHGNNSAAHERQLAFARHAQAAHDEIVAQQLAYEKLTARLHELESQFPQPEDSWSLKEAVRRRVKRHSLQLWMRLRHGMGRMPLVAGVGAPASGSLAFHGVRLGLKVPELLGRPAEDLLTPLVNQIQAHLYPKLSELQQMAVNARLSLGQNALAELAVQVRQTELFDETAYRALAELQDASMDAALHYVIVGEIAGFAPSSSFDPRYYARRNPDVANSGMVLLVHYAVAGRNEKRLPVAPKVPELVGRPAEDLLTPFVERIQAHLYPKLSELQQVAVNARLSLGRNLLAELAVQVRQTELFDDAAYRAVAELQDASMDAALHYVIVGEIAGFAPSSSFNPRYYARRNPDVVNSGMVLLIHYAVAGRNEKRLPVAPEMKHVNPKRFSPKRENVIVVVHEASRTGAPILGWNIVEKLTSTYNVFSICLGDGPLVPEFQAVSTETYGPFPRDQNHWVDLDESLQDLFRGRVFRYAIVNSTESRPVIDVFVKRFIPTFFLVHEYAFYVSPVEALRRAFNLSTEVVFPTRGVAVAAREVHPPLADRPVRIIPQGQSLIPSSHTKKKPGRNKALETVLAKQAEGQFIVLGAGSVHLRKGVDLFLAAAAAVAKRNPARPVHFAWVGHGYKPDEDMGYSIYLREQLRRSGLTGGMTFVDEVADMQPLYRAADVMLLTSRLDPLPNVSIDAACEGIPVICFREASGTADIMSEHADTALAVVPHLDADAAAEVLVKLASDLAAYDALASATTRLAREIFDMDRYVAQLDALLPGCVERMAALQDQHDTLIRDPRFDMAFFLEPGEHMTRPEALARYLTAASLPGLDMSERRPAPGFNGNLYREAHPELPIWKTAFSSFVERKYPPGPWQLDVLTPDFEHKDSPTLAVLRCCLYISRAENRTIDDILARLAPNQHPCDLIISTDDDAEVEALREGTTGYTKGRIHFVVRDGDTDHSDFPVLMASMAQYDVIGCLSGTGTNADPDAKLDLTTLIGDKHAMMDRILAAFTEQPDLGLVFTANPKNRIFDAAQYRCVEDMARQLCLSMSSRYYDFSHTAAFWARNTVLERIKAVEPSQCLNDEKKPFDILQRVLPIAAETLGARVAVAHVSELAP